MWVVVGPELTRGEDNLSSLSVTRPTTPGHWKVGPIRERLGDLVMIDLVNDAWHLVLSLDTLIAFDTIGGNFLVVTLKRGQVLASFGEFAFLHTLSDVPVHERALRVHEVEFV